MRTTTRGITMSVRVVLASIAIAIVLLSAVVAVVITSGWYDVAADAPHTALVTNVISFARERSIEMRAASLKAPALNNPMMIAEGAEHYAAMCTGCHLAPGMRENEMRPGLNPKPPALAALPPGNPAEQFWIIKHGLKMTAMPAWGTTHSDEDIWNMVAFVQELPRMSTARYRALTQNAEDHHGHMDH
jgi:mono/diheme cytochrome c family protein